MAQKDYVGRGRSTGTRRKKTNSRSKKRSNGSGVSKIMVVLAAAVLVIFVGGLWFVAHHKKEKAPVIADRKAPGNSLPPKPEERWRYIKELENRQITVPMPTEPSAGGKVHFQTQLTNEQRQLLEQMQADMRQQPTQLNEVPWNEQTPAQHQQNQQRSPPPQARTQTQPTAQTQTAQQPKEVQKEKSQHWMVQCGSFKGTDQAESIRARLAFEGFESRIITGSGWNRVVIGPFSNRASADSTLKSLHGHGHTNCIPLAIGG